MNMTQMEITCSLCGEKSESESTPTSCPICNASLTTPQQETVLKETICVISSSCAGVTAQKGTLFLTNQRIFWLRHSPYFFKGVIANFASKLLSPPKEMMFSFRLDQVAEIQILRVGPFKQVKLTAVGGEIVVLDIKAKHRQEWIDAVNDAKERFALEEG